jgi:hypothetical protein
MTSTCGKTPREKAASGVASQTLRKMPFPDDRPLWSSAATNDEDGRQNHNILLIPLPDVLRLVQGILTPTLPRAPQPQAPQVNIQNLNVNLSLGHAGPPPLKIKQVNAASLAARVEKDKSARCRNGPSKKIAVSQPLRERLDNSFPRRGCAVEVADNVPLKEAMAEPILHETGGHLRPSSTPLTADCAVQQERDRTCISNGFRSSAAVVADTRFLDEIHQQTQTHLEKLDADRDGGSWLEYSLTVFVADTRTGEGSF